MVTPHGAGIFKDKSPENPTNLISQAQYLGQPDSSVP